MAVPLTFQYIICGFVLVLATLGLARSYGLLGRRAGSTGGCSKGCGSCQNRLLQEDAPATPELNLQRVRRFKLH